MDYQINTFKKTMLTIDHALTTLRVQDETIGQNKSRKLKMRGAEVSKILTEPNQCITKNSFDRWYQ
jgi:hypothetical protein